MIAAVATSLDLYHRCIGEDAENRQVEFRRPGFMAENFMNMLEALGNASRVLVLQKHIREDIL